MLSFDNLHVFYLQARRADICFLGDEFAEKGL